MLAWDWIRSLPDRALSLTSDQVSATADTGLLIVAIIAAVVTGYQIRAARRIQRESSARGAYSDLLNLDLQYPKYANPNFQRILDGGEFTAYSSYCSNLFVTLNDILETCTRKERFHWEQSALYQLAWHASFIRSSYFNFGEGYYDENMMALFRKAAGNPISYIGPEHEFWNDKTAFLPKTPSNTASASSDRVAASVPATA